VFHSAQFRLVEMRLLDEVGSDHLPVYVELCLEPDAAQEQEAPQRDAGDEAEGEATLAAARDAQALAANATYCSIST
jgi:hypothetical protein